MSTPMEGLRQLVGSKNWDYCILWKLSEDQRFLEFMDCCCCGSEAGNIENETIGEELLFSCRDGMFAHPRTTTCEILSQFPSSQHLDGINMEILISNQPRWLNFSNVSDLNVSEESLGTKVLIPIPGGLAELYAAKQVTEDLSVIDYVMTQCNILAEQGQMSNLTDTVLSYPINMNMVNELESTMNESEAQMTFTNAIGGGTLNFCDGTDFSMNYLQQFNYASENGNNTRSDFLEVENGSFQVNHSHQHGLDNSENGFQGTEKGSLQKQDGGRVGSVSDSEQLDDDEEDEPKYRRRGAKGPQAKNLVAERKRRKKLNERLYILRSLVPNISKLDKAAILVDAIEYVQELQKEAEDLQDELNRNSDDEGTNHNIMTDLPHNNFPAQVSNGNNAPLFGPDYDHEKLTNGFRVGENESLKSNYDPKNANDKAQQMEVQVEVGQLEGNDFYVKVFGEQKKGGIVRLMEALNGLGLEITNVNMTSCISLVSYVFIVKKRDSENFHAEYLRDSLMEATRNCQAGYWTEMTKPSENGDGIDHHHQQHLRLNHPLETFHNHFHHHLGN